MDIEDKNYNCDDKMVSHPSHYISDKGIETIDVIEAFTSDLTGIEAVDTGQVLKYICRWKKKNGVQDLNKAMWYLTHLINHLNNEEKTTFIMYADGEPILEKTLIKENE